MTANLNDHIDELLSWHGHAAGGVHVPFQQRPNPIGQVIETPLVSRLRQLAAQIAASNASRPRWVFLVGGPGNGKSETVQDFLEHLDTVLALGGELVQSLRQKFSRSGLLPRKVEILPTDLTSGAATFASAIGKLMVIQDATATEDAMGNAARELADDLADLLTVPDTPPLPVFVACANRGLLARAMNEAVRVYSAGNPVTTLLANVIQASSLGLETLTGRRHCWPLDADDRFACWPLDVDSLLAANGGTSPLDQILCRAVEPGRWETAGKCFDCSANSVCPFRQNAAWLRDSAIRSNLLTLLRRGELARGQRWNFRDAFSLVAELLIGQWSDFGDATHPCRWVHEHHAAVTTNPPVTQSALALTSHLYPHAMFVAGHLRQATAIFLERRLASPQSQPITRAVISGIAQATSLASVKPIRETLASDYLRLDPATSTPTDPMHPLRVIEDAFCQSVEQGRSVLQQHAPPAIAEDALLDQLEKAEQEWDLLGRDSATAMAAVSLLRKIAGAVAKRSAGMRLGYHALDDYLADYEASLRNATRLANVRSALQPLLGDATMGFNLLEILGQPTAERPSPVSLRVPQPGIRLVVAPSGTSQAPGHDIPCIEFTDPVYRVPLTFDFFMALRLRREGCAGSSLPASVRAALDRTRHRFAGVLCRRDEFFIDGRASIVLPSGDRITVASAGDSPSLAPQ